MDRAQPQAHQLQTYDSADPIDPTAETVINAAPYVISEVHSGGRESQARQDAAASAIKDRLVSLAGLYLAAQRDTVGG